MSELSGKYKSLVAQIDSLFTVSSTLQDLYLKSLEEYEKIIKNFRAAPKGEPNVSRNLTLLQNIGKGSIEKTEKQNLSTLYAQAVILIVSVTEVFLDDLFRQLLKERLFSLKKKKEIIIPYREFSEHKGFFTEDDWANLLMSRIEDNKNTEEKLNLQNIRQISGLFDGYFGIKLEVPEALSSKLNVYYQVRHLFIHKGGKVDNQFLNNIRTFPNTNKFTVGQKLMVSKAFYLNCKKDFIKFIEIIEVSCKK